VEKKLRVNEESSVEQPEMAVTYKLSAVTQTPIV